MERTKCEICRGALVEKEVDYSLYGVSLGKFPADVCTKCGEEVFDEKTSAEIEKAARKKGVWGIAKKVKIVKMGNALAVMIPKEIAEFFGLKAGKEALIHPEKDKIVIES